MLDVHERLERKGKRFDGELLKEEVHACVCGRDFMKCKKK